MSTNYSTNLVSNCMHTSSPIYAITNEQKQQQTVSPSRTVGGNNTTTTTTTTTTNKSQQQLKSPVAKRTPNSTVTLQGWLHKQGSDGLQLWRKRWFVLSELCLYYYKSNEEDKLLGSVLLPSYRVSECRAEDKVVRKFAFKLEHTNMRTYLLAAESHKSMLEWICALNLACMLQTPTSYSSINPNKQTPSSPINETKQFQNVNNQQQIIHGFQPLYENAPPKPRRVSESARYNDYQQDYFYNTTPQKYSHVIYANQQEQQLQQQKQQQQQQQQHQQQQQQPQMHYYSSYPPIHQHHSHNIIIERRTPDTYGRSPTHCHNNISSGPLIINKSADYEDVYASNVNKNDLYEPPTSPLAYNHVRKNCPNPQVINQYQRNYRPLNMENNYQRQIAKPQYIDYRKPPVREIISRPHSVDFLEHKNSPDDYQYRQPERPKSSLDINKYYNDESDLNEYYSEQDYANKMRQSAMYLHYRSLRSPEYGHHVLSLEQQRIYQQQQQQLNEIRSSYPAPSTQNHQRDSHFYKHSQPSQQQINMATGQVRSRSKSPARYTQGNTSDTGITSSSTSIETNKKREESMKRLIEWKQRMLQSPLHHKQMSRKQQMRYNLQNSSTSIDINQKLNNTVTTSTPILQQQQHLLDIPVSNNNIYRSPPTPSSIQNTSYSSDDEDTEHCGNVDVLSHQAGGTNDTTSSTFTGEISLTTTVSVSATSADSKQLINNNDTSQTPDDQSLLKETIINEDTSTDNVSESNTNTNTKTNTNTNTNGEQHYMIMIPKKSILAPPRNVALFESLSCESEESSYVEMMRNLGPSLLDSNCQTTVGNDMQTYETVCFSNGVAVDSNEKTEPVYMELSGQDKGNLFSRLPDILMNSEKQKSSKSDSSDADDEASKDFNSLDAPTQPRFSLSDTFRPASYYLGANRVLAEFQDSSDSELVSPPPIPDSSALLDDLDQSDDITPSTGNSNSIELSKKKKSTLDFATFRKNLTNTSSERQHIRSFSAIDSYSNKEFDNKNDILYKRRPVSSDFCTNLDSFLLDDNFETSRESIYTPMAVSYEEEHEYENVCMIKQKLNDNLNSSSNTLTSSASESTFVAKERSALTESPCSSTFINPSSFDTSSNFDTSSIQFNSAKNNCKLKSLLINKSETSPDNRIMTQLSRDYYLLELLRSSGNSDSSTSTKNLSVNNNDSDSKLDKQVRKADMFQIALAAKSPVDTAAATIDIMKFGKINNKNIYHDQEDHKRMTGSSDSKKDNNWSKIDGNQTNESLEIDDPVRRSHSLEGILQNVFKENDSLSVQKNINEKNISDDVNEGDHLWEEDCVWQENLRRASHRHARSLDDLQIVTNVQKSTVQRPTTKLTRGVTYVNDCVTFKEHNKYTSGVIANTTASRSNDRAFTIDREKLRQWDLMSSAPVLTTRPINVVNSYNIATSSLSQPPPITNANNSNNIVPQTATMSSSSTADEEMPNNEKVADIENDDTKIHYDKQTASGSISIVSGHDSHQSLDHSQWSLPDPNRITSSNIRSNISQYYNDNRYGFRAGSLPRTVNHQTPKRRQVYQKMPVNSIADTVRNCNISTIPTTNKLSAGELLGRTHEELVLLLIQLRRQSISTCQAIEACNNEIDLLKSTMAQGNENRELENLQRLEQLQSQLLDLGKRYEKNKPLVNLVDNMVKLGSLYQRNGNNCDKLNAARNRERLQFNQYVQERRLLAEEKRDWNKLNLNHAQLQNKIQQLYELDSALRHESGTLTGLRKEKEYLESALQSLQNRLTDPILPSTPPAELDRVRRHQQMLERELNRVHVLLAYNSKKLEETVAGNARIEQELLVLRQKLQMTQRQRHQQSYLSNTIPKDRKSLAESVPEMENELKRVQWLMGDLQKQRQELSVQVRHLTDKSQNLAHQLHQSSTSPSSDSFHRPRSTTPTNATELMLDSQASRNDLKRSPSSWLETDLDQDNNKKLNGFIGNGCGSSGGFHSDDSSTTSTIAGIISTDTSDTQQSSSMHGDKQEIKTVRIVKRESERRHRDRERSSVGGSSTPLSLITSSKHINTTSNSNLMDSFYNDDDVVELSSYPSSKSTDSLSTFKSTTSVVSSGRRTVPKEKRRHHTAPDNNHISRELSLISGTSDGDTNSWMKSERSLDDLDMERALRPRINTPDVVRSTLGHKEIKYNERTIDNILGTPSKIVIPERYMPQDLPKLSAEEECQRLRKVESIKKMLSDTTSLPSSATIDSNRTGSGGTGTAYTMSEEKRQREHLLHLNQILAKQVIEMSKIVAGSKDKKPDTQ